MAQIAAEAEIPLTVHNEEQLLYLSQMKANIATNIQANFTVGERVVVVYDGDHYEGTVADAEYRVDEYGDAIFHYLVWFNSFRMPDWVHGSLLYSIDDPKVQGRLSSIHASAPPAKTLPEQVKAIFVTPPPGPIPAAPPDPG